ncbi:MAG TPA: DNA repair protein RecO [Chloroflexi bacterium]|nr:DNA repair protein RecO [Chloroflexota bacterium]
MPRKLRSFRANAIVLKHQDFGEADRILTVYTREKGKLRVIAKGVRKVHSRKGGHLEPFTHVSLQLAEGRNWPLVSQAEAQQTYDNLKKDLETIGYASYVVELVERFTFEEEENASIFNLLKNTLTRLNRGDPAQLAIRYYEIRLLDLLGFRPELNTCVVSGEEIRPENQYFSAALGGVVSAASGKDLAGAVPVSVRALKYLRHFQRSSYREATRAMLAPEIQQELEVLMQYYLTYLLERGLNTPSFLRRVRRDAND